MNESAGRTGRQRSNKTGRRTQADEEREKEMRPPDSTRITIQEKLDPNDIYIMWDDQEQYVPQNVLKLREKLLNFPRLVPMEYEERFRRYMDEDRDQFIHRGYYEESKKEQAQAAVDIGKAAEEMGQKRTRESQWVERIAEELVFKKRVYDIHNQDHSEVFDRLKIADNLQFLKEPCSKLVHVGPNYGSKPRPDLLFGLPILEKQEITQFDTDRMLKYFEETFLTTFSETIVTTPTNPDHGLCFPWGAYEAKMNLTETQKKPGEVYIQIAKASAVCAALLKRLSNMSGTHLKVPPVISFASVGAEWDVFLCYKQPSSLKYIVLQIWKGDMTNNWHALQLLHIWDYTKTWALRTFKPWVVDCLESLHKLKGCNATPKRRTGQCTRAAGATPSSRTPSVASRSRQPEASPSKENRAARAGRKNRKGSQSPDSFSNPGPHVPNSPLLSPDPGQRKKATATIEGELRLGRNIMACIRISATSPTSPSPSPSPPSSENRTAHARRQSRRNPQSPGLFSNTRPPVSYSPQLSPDRGQRTKARTTREGEASSNQLRLTPSRIRRSATPSPEPPVPKLRTPEPAHRTKAKATRAGEASPYLLRLTPSRTRLSVTPLSSPSPSPLPPNCTYDARQTRWDPAIRGLQKHRNETCRDKRGDGNFQGFHCEQAYIGAPTRKSLKQRSKGGSDDKEGSDKDGSEYEMDTDNEEGTDNEEDIDSEESTDSEDTDWEEDIIYDSDQREWA